MPKATRKDRSSLAEFLPLGEGHYRDLKRRQIFRLLITYLVPLLVLIIYFTFQYSQLASEGRRTHLTEVAENQANTLNLFLSERLANLRNLINNPVFPEHLTSEILDYYLEDLTRVSAAFVDLGFFDESGVQAFYSGPFHALVNREYGNEAWFKKLIGQEEDFVITDIYLGFRQEPHFTIAVKKPIEGKYSILRATLAPQKIYDYMRSPEEATEVSVSIVNRDGYYQLVTPHIGTLLDTSSIVPPLEPRYGAQEVRLGGAALDYGYSWLRLADWALIVQRVDQPGMGLLWGVNRTFLVLSSSLIILFAVAIYFRAGKLVELEMKADRTKAQLEHASKLASVGELAAGIAHEINNPLAIINEEAGLMKDLMSSEFGEPSPPEELVTHLDVIEHAVFRCRDITHKLLGFVRKSHVELRPHNVAELVDGVIDGLLGREFAVSDIEIVRHYDPRLPDVPTDANQLEQVLLNIFNNAVDALEGRPGRIEITVSRRGKSVAIAITDNGKGMTQEQLGKMFLPFYTTKEVGRGTGLGLSVSHGIVEDLGGEIEVESQLNQGSTFTIVLPIL